MIAVAAHGQQTVPVSGGTTTGEEGSISFTLGQIFCQSDFEPAVTVNIVTASVNEGVQQPYTVDQLAVSGVSSLKDKISIYPNPAKNSLTVEVDSRESGFHYALYGIDGRWLQEGTVQGRVQLDITRYASGTYLLQIDDGRNNKNLYRIIKVN